MYTQTYNGVWGGFAGQIVYSLVTDALGNLYGPLYNSGIISRWLVTTPTSSSPQTTWYLSTPTMLHLMVFDLILIC